MLYFSRKPALYDLVMSVAQMMIMMSKKTFPFKMLSNTPPASDVETFQTFTFPDVLQTFMVARFWRLMFIIFICIWHGPRQKNGRFLQKLIFLIILVKDSMTSKDIKVTGGNGRCWKKTSSQWTFSPQRWWTTKVIPGFCLYNISKYNRNIRRLDDPTMRQSMFPAVSHLSFHILY